MGAKCTKDCYTQDLYIKCPIAGCTKETHWECLKCGCRISICMHASSHCGCRVVNNIWKTQFICKEQSHKSTIDYKKLTSALEKLTSAMINDMADSIEDFDLKHSLMTNLELTKNNTRLFL